MKKLLILSIAILPFLYSCDKDNGNDEPEPSNDTVPAADTLIEPVYIDFYDYGKRPVPIRFDSLVSMYPNDKFWFWGSQDVFMNNIWTYRGVDTIINGVQQLKIYYADLYAWGMVKGWKEDGFMRDSAGSWIWKGKTYYDFYLKEGDVFKSKVVTDSIDFLHLDSIGYMLVDSIVPRTMEDGSTRNYFYLSSKYAKSVAYGHDSLKFSYAVWIDGIGILSDEMDIGYISGSVGGGDILLRYYERNKLIYKNDWPQEYGYLAQ